MGSCATTIQHEVSFTQTTEKSTDVSFNKTDVFQIDSRNYVLCDEEELFDNKPKPDTDTGYMDSNQHSLAFNTNSGCCGNRLEFTKNDRVVTKCTDSSSYVWNTCFLNHSITDEMCNVYKLYFKWNKTGTERQHNPQFSMGFITSTIEESVNDLTHILGTGNNKNIFCTGIVKDKNSFWIFDINHENQKLNYESRKPFKKGDIFMMEFDFKNDAMTIYCNNKKTVSISLNNQKKITPAVQFPIAGLQIELIKQKYE
eukprot:541153_1